MFGAKRFISLIFVLGSFQFAYAQDSNKIDGSDLKVSKMVFCAEIIGREPLSEESSFTNDTKKIFCFTRIEGAQFDMQIKHRWFYGDSLMAEVALPVRSSSWRTYSSKNMHKKWLGTWKVVVVDDTGKALREEIFIYKQKETD
ncbi:MAG: DUF2914 domain-containing protein [bacterium]